MRGNLHVLLHLQFQFALHSHCSPTIPPTPLHKHCPGELAEFQQEGEGQKTSTLQCMTSVSWLLLNPFLKNKEASVLLPGCMTNPMASMTMHKNDSVTLCRRFEFLQNKEPFFPLKLSTPCWFSCIES